MKIGDEIMIIEMYGEPSMKNKCGEILHIDDIGQLHGSWGGLAVCEEDTIEGINAYLNYLEALRKSGVTNMFGAVPYLLAFADGTLSKEQAKAILIYWMNNYEHLCEKFKWRR